MSACWPTDVKRNSVHYAYALGIILLLLYRKFGLPRSVSPDGQWCTVVGLTVVCGSQHRTDGLETDFSKYGLFNGFFRYPFFFLFLSVGLRATASLILVPCARIISYVFTTYLPRGFFSYRDRSNNGFGRYRKIIVFFFNTYVHASRYYRNLSPATLTIGQSILKTISSVHRCVLTNKEEL